MDRAEMIKGILEVIAPKFDEEHTKSIQMNLEKLEDRSLVFLHGKTAVVIELLNSEAAAKDNAIVELSKKDASLENSHVLALAWARKGARYFAMTNLISEAEKLIKDWTKDDSGEVPTSHVDLQINHNLVMG